MTTIKTLLAAGATLSLLCLPAMAGTHTARAIILAQDATSTDAVAAAEAAVEAARTELRAALAAGQGVEEARQKLRDALQAFEAARIAAGLPPTANPADLEPVLPEESTAPAVVEPPPAETPTPPPTEETPPPPPPADETPPPAPPADTAPAVVEPLPPPPADATPPAEQVTPPPAPTEEVTPPPAEEKPPVPAEQVAPPSTEQQPPAVEPPAGPAPVIELPAPVVEEPPPPPPPAATEGAFDLQKFKARPKFGEAPAAAAAAPPAALPKSEEAVKEGAVLAAPDGRLIVKEGGQVTVLHDDSGRFRQRGDQVRTDATENDTQTTTFVRPDGTEIVTVRDQGGNIIQRYRKNKNGSIEVLIGEVEQPGMVGRIFGKGPQPGRPGPRRQPQLRLNLGPLQLTIPQQQYIVESSRASEQQLQEALMAPPVEQVERTYSLEEIRRSGRLRDKVRRIDFDTVTFDTGQATVSDDQIQKMQGIGQALRDLIDRDPTQVILIEGHTDAVGSDLSNLALSDRRAETVAEILSYYFGVPPENLITQGYGEQFLKIPTVTAERENRRVAFRNITYLLRTSQAQ